MSEDIFSQFFNLFNNNDSDVNWELSKQINKHLNKDSNNDILQLSNADLNLEELFRFFMSVKNKIGVNGFGRIGRYLTRMAILDPNVEIGLINDLQR